MLKVLVKDFTIKKFINGNDKWIWLVLDQQYKKWIS